MVFSPKKPATTKFQPKAAAKVEEERQDAKFMLKVGVSDSKEKPEIVCLLWEAKTKKNDTFFKGTHRETKTKFFMMPDSKTKGFRLTCAEEGTEGFKNLCAMTEKTTKSGETFYTGVDADAQTWFCFSYTKKKD
jgi:hypothetical protein